MKTQTKLFLYTLIFLFINGCSNDNKGGDSEESIPISKVVGRYKAVFTSSGVDNKKIDTHSSDLWIITENSIRVGCQEVETYSYSKNTIKTANKDYYVSIKEEQLKIRYSENSISTTVALIPTNDKCEDENQVVLSQIIGTHKVIKASSTDTNNSAKNMIGNLWVISSTALQMNCGKLEAYDYANDTFIIDKQVYYLSLKGANLQIVYTLNGVITTLELAASNEACPSEIKLSELVGRYKITASSSEDMMIGDLWDIDHMGIRISCATRNPYTYEPKASTLEVATITYSIVRNKDKQLSIEYTANGIYTVLQLTPSIEVCVSNPSISPKTSLKKANIEQVLQKVADWQIGIYNYPAQGHPQGGMLDFTSGTLFIGMMHWAEIASDKKYDLWMKNTIGDRTNWRISTTLSVYPSYSIFHADDLCIGQNYLLGYDKYRDTKMMVDTKKRLDNIIQRKPNETMAPNNKQSWTWCDALFMAPSTYIQMAKMSGDRNYLDFMKKQFKMCYDHLYDKDSKLFYRDATYFDRKEANGEKVFWGRGQGWVVAGLANMLKYLPEDYSERIFYESLLVEMVEKLIKSQDQQGFWHASLLDMDTYDTPETSASTLITYAIAYGLNNGLLDEAKYMPILEKAWYALTTAIHPNGKLGWVQPIGQDPKKVTYDMTAVYGVGGLMLAGAEIHRMAK